MKTLFLALGLAFIFSAHAQHDSHALVEMAPVLDTIAPQTSMGKELKSPAGQNCAEEKEESKGVVIFDLSMLGKIKATDGIERISGTDQFMARGIVTIVEEASEADAVDKLLAGKEISQTAYAKYMVINANRGLATGVSVRGNDIYYHKKNFTMNANIDLGKVKFSMRSSF